MTTQFFYGHYFSDFSYLIFYFLFIYLFIFLHPSS